MINPELDLSRLTEKERELYNQSIKGCMCCARVIPVLHKLAHIRGVLRKHEWDGLGGCVCIECLQHRVKGHTPDCWKGNLLQEEEKL